MAGETVKHVVPICASTHQTKANAFRATLILIIKSDARRDQSSHRTKLTGKEEEARQSQPPNIVVVHDATDGMSILQPTLLSTLLSKPFDTHKKEER